ncbi:hypothetical protein OCA5_c18620 [Afipia carboxidovorans OM5]|uniref:Uncharacterized protein n=1 Tax=Afipia carboxidovorans (strain ATCC 49405 / DSM 1227 / KCTC 32145 / OM5) TaxID=504832 RepID=F8BTS5_AFIC5|nr:hypothetical protein OCA4_c18610 [Afipia carboxidovorans OM4]AEI06575.1 hypothetical protein OCA5_c18620 [Afipia carboxidovorans OM5]
MTIRVNAPAAYRGRLVKVASINGSDAEIVWIGHDGDINLRSVHTDDLVDFQEATSLQSSWSAAGAIEHESTIRSWRAA